MDERLYLKEIYNFQEGDDYFGLDVGNALFFKMNKITWDIIDSFPHHDKLTRVYEPSQLNDAVNSLKKNGFITPLPPAAGQPDREPAPVTGMGLCMYADGKEMPLPVIRKSIDLLVREPGAYEDRRLLFITDDFDKSREAIETAVTYAKAREKEYKRKITFALRTGKFPSSSQCVRLCAAQNIALEIVLEEAPFHWDFQHSAAPIPDNTMVTINPNSRTMSSLDIVLNNLHRTGFKKVFLDTLCPRCREKPTEPGADDRLTIRAIKQYSLGPAKNRNDGGLINLVPLIHAVMTSSKISYGCRAGLNYIAVSPDGEIYPCQGKMESKRFKLGNVFNGLDQTPRKNMVHRHVDNKEKCRLCGVRYFCGGGPVPGTGGPSPHECEIIRELAEYAMITYNQLSLKKKTWVINTYKWMKGIMPYRWETTKKIQPEKRTRRLTVKGSSMRPFLNEGDRVIVRSFDVEKVRIGDIVCFGKPVTCHRVIRKSRKNGRLVVLEKGDRQLTGTRIPANEISGKVVTVHKGNHTLTLDNKRWHLLNRFTAVISLLAHTTGKVFIKGETRR